jgi:hypothetical protein
VGVTIGVALGLVLSDTLDLLFIPSMDEAVRSRPAGPRVSLSNALAGATSGSVIGAALGSAQWLVLRRHAGLAGWWIMSSCLGWLIGLSIAAGTVDVVGIVGSLVILGLGGGAATGLTLARLIFVATPSGEATGA